MKTQSPERDKFTLELVNPILFVLSLIPFGGVLVYMFCFFRDMIFRNQGFQENMFSGMQNSIEILSFAIILLSLLTPSSYALPFLKNPPKPKYWLIGSVVISIWALICWAVVGIIIYVAFKSSSMSFNGLGGGLAIALIGVVVSTSSVYTFRRYRYLKS